jgi:hypothetical protein
VGQGVGQALGFAGGLSLKITGGEYFEMDTECSRTRDYSAGPFLHPLFEYCHESDFHYQL